VEAAVTGSQCPPPPRSPFGSPTKGCIHPSRLFTPFGRSHGVKRGSGRGRVRQATCPADHLAPTVESRSARGGSAWRDGARGPGAGRTGRQQKVIDGRRAADEARATRPTPEFRGLIPLDTGRQPGDSRRSTGTRLRPAGRPRGTGFVADHHRHRDHQPRGGRRTDLLVPAHLRRPHLCGHRRRPVTSLPDADSGSRPHRSLGVDPLPVTVAEPVEAGTTSGSRGAGASPVLGASASPTRRPTASISWATHWSWRSVRRRRPLRLARIRRGPVLDASTGGGGGPRTALHSGHRVAGSPSAAGSRCRRTAHWLLSPQRDDGACVRGRSESGGCAELTRPPWARRAGTSAGRTTMTPVRRTADAVREFEAFGTARPAVLGLVGPPGSGRTTNWRPRRTSRCQGGHRRPPCGCAAPTSSTRTRSWRTRRHGRWSGRAGSWRLAGRPALSGCCGSDVLLPRPYDGELADIGPERLARWHGTRGGRCCCSSTVRGRCRGPAHRHARVDGGHGRLAAEKARARGRVPGGVLGTVGAEFPGELLAPGRMPPPSLPVPPVYEAGRFPAACAGGLTEGEALRPGLARGSPRGARGRPTHGIR